MKIWILQIVETLPLFPGVRKMRTALLADELRRRGHEVDWFASAFHHQEKKFLELDAGPHTTDTGVRIHLLKGSGYKKNLSLRRIMDHRKLAREFSRISPELEKPDLIIVSSPDHHLAYHGAQFAKKRGIPYIVDVRDQWPEIFVEHLPKFLRAFARIALVQDYQRFRFVIKNAHSVTSMMKELLDWALKFGEREKSDQDQVFYLGCPSHRSQTTSDRFADLRQQVVGKKVATFIGTFGSYYQPKVLAEIARDMQSENIHFVLGGHGVFFDEVASAAEGLRNVSLTGWLKDHEINEILELSDFAVVCANRPVHAFPNKAFVYFSASLPVINACSGELEELIEKYRVGLNYPAGDRIALEKAIRALSNDEACLKQMTAAAGALFQERLNAETIYKKFADFIESAVKSPSTEYRASQRGELGNLR